MKLTNEIKKTLEDQIEKLTSEFNENGKRAAFFLEKKQQIDGSLKILVNKGTLATAKIEALKDILKE